MIGREKRKNHCLTSQRLANQQQLSRQNIFEGKKGEEGGFHGCLESLAFILFFFLSFFFFFLSVYQKLTPEHRGQGNPTLWIYVNTFRCSGRTVLLLSSSLLPRLVVEWSRHPSKMSSGKAPRVQGLKKSKASTNPDRALPKGAVAGQVTANSRLLPDVF